MRQAFLALVVLASVAVSAQPGGDGYYHTRSTRLVGPDGQPDVLRGIGLGGWLMPEGYMVRVPGHGSPTTIRQQAVEVAGEEGADRYFEAFRANYVREEDIQKIAEWGYDHVRLPFHYKVLWDEEAGAFDESGFALFDEFLEWCREAGLPVIFDMHAAPGGQSEHNIADAHGTAELWVGPNAAANQALTIRIWAEVARRYRDDRLVIGYDIINEPVLPEGVTRAELRDFYVRATEAIRAIDPHHVLFIEGDFFANFFDGLTPAFDDNMVWSFHKYWSPTDPAEMARFVELRDSTGVPLWLGETGENSNDWFHEVSTWAVENGIGWNWWTHKKIETVTSPLSAPMWPGYRDLVAYWRGEGPKPDRETAEAALLAQAAALHIDSTTFRPDVLWSLFDPAWATLAVPFKPHALPGTIDAVDYDLGADGVGYHDARSKNEGGTPGLANEGGVYRNDGVDIARDGELGHRVGWTEAGEWLQYTVRVPAGGTFGAVASTSGGGGRLALTVDGEPWGEAAVPASGATWAEVDLGTRAVPAGPRVLRVEIVEGGFDLGRLTFVPAD